MEKLFSIEEPEKLEYLAKKVKEKGLKEVPLPVDFILELAEFLKDAKYKVKRTYP